MQYECLRTANTVRGETFQFFDYAWETRHQRVYVDGRALGTIETPYVGVSRIVEYCLRDPKVIAALAGRKVISWHCACYDNYTVRFYTIGF